MFVHVNLKNIALPLHCVHAYCLPCSTCAISSITSRRAGSSELTMATTTDMTKVNKNSGSGNSSTNGISMNKLNCSVREMDTSRPADGCTMSCNVVAHNPHVPTIRTHDRAQGERGQHHSHGLVDVHSDNLPVV